MPNKVWAEFTYPFPNFNGAVISTLHFIMDVIAYPYWDLS